MVQGRRICNMNSAQYDHVSIEVWAETDEMTGSDAVDTAFYKDIYHVRLNRTVQITFVPAFQRSKTDWPPALSSYPNTFPVDTVEQARSTTAALADYVVTPACHEKENVAPFVLEGFDDVPPNEGVMFLTSQQEFEEFECELSGLVYETLGRRSNLRLIDLDHNKVIQFLLSHVVCSPYIQKKDVWALKNSPLLMK